MRLLSLIKRHWLDQSNETPANKNDSGNANNNNNQRATATLSTATSATVSYTHISRYWANQRRATATITLECIEAFLPQYAPSYANLHGMTHCTGISCIMALNLCEHSRPNIAVKSASAFESNLCTINIRPDGTKWYSSPCHTQALESHENPYEFA